MLEVYLNDTGMSYDDAKQHFLKAHHWARKNCPSYRLHAVVEVADFSYTNDLIARYTFQDEKDVIMFQLKWSS